MKELLDQSRRVRNYSNPDEVFEAVPTRFIIGQVETEAPTAERSAGSGEGFSPVTPSKPDTYEAGQYLFNALRTFLGMAGIDASDCKLVIELPDRDRQRHLVGTLQRHTGERGSVRSAARIGNHSGLWQGVEYEFSVKGWNHEALASTPSPQVTTKGPK